MDVRFLAFPENLYPAANATYEAQTNKPQFIARESYGVQKQFN